MADTVYVSAKCSDLCFTEFDGVEHDGYVPGIPGFGGGGDYLNLEIENETGRIIGWKPLTRESWIELIQGEK